MDKKIIYYIIALLIYSICIFFSGYNFGHNRDSGNAERDSGVEAIIEEGNRTITESTERAEDLNREIGNIGEGVTRAIDRTESVQSISGEISRDILSLNDGQSNIIQELQDADNSAQKVEERLHQIIEESKKE
jgi:hypothetical protein